MAFKALDEGCYQQHGTPTLVNVNQGENASAYLKKSAINDALIYAINAFYKSGINLMINQN